MMEQAKKGFDEFNTFLQQYPMAVTLGDKTGQKPATVVGGAIAFFVFIFLMTHGADFVCNLISFTYPVFASFKALKSQQSERDVHWLTYWVTWAFFAVVEDFAAAVMDESVWSTVYFLVKAAFLVWCFLPQTQGATKVYKRLIEPVLLRYETQADAATKFAEGAVNEVKDDAKSAGSKLAEAALTKAAEVAVKNQQQ